MVRKIYLFVTAFITFSYLAVAQNNQGMIKVTITDKGTKEPIPYANIVVYNGKVQVAAGTADFDGNVIIKPLAPGKYNVAAVYVGYGKQEIDNVLVLNDKPTYLSVKMEAGVNLTEVTKVEYQVDLIDKDTKTGATVTREQYQQMANKDVNTVISTAAGVYQQDVGGGINVRGSRSSGTNVFVDGERAIGTTNIPQQAVEQMSVILGGLPAQYGDVTGGVVSVTTRGPQPKYFGGIEAISSQLTDKYGYNFLGFSLGGPLLNTKDSSGSQRPILGFFIGGEAVYQKDPNPWANGISQVKKDKLSQVEAHPVTYNPITKNYYRSAEYLNSNDFYTSAVRPNVAQKRFALSPKIDFAPTPNLNITVGGTIDYVNGHLFVYEYALLNSQHNPQQIQNTMRGYVRLTQRFGPTSSAEQEKSQSIFKRAFFTAQVGYQQYKSTTQDEQFKNNYFQYGYIGKFDEQRQHIYVQQDSVKASSPTGPANWYKSPKGSVPGGGGLYTYIGDADTLITFTPGSSNPLAANYTSQVMNAFSAAGTPVSSYAQITQNNGLMNGDRPQNSQSLWFNTGRTYNGYSVFDQRIFRVTSNFSADVKNHSLMVGVEFDQRDERGFNINGITGLWSQARQLMNQHNQSLSSDTLSAYSGMHSASTWTVHPGDVYYSVNALGQLQTNYTNDTFRVIQYPYIYNASQQSVFSKNFYDQVLGIHDNSNGGYLRYVNIDQYDPSKFNLAMFAPDELLQQGTVDSWGYDYTGKRLSSKVSFNDYLNKTHTDKFGDTIHDRLLGAFRPIYMAGYIQDKFDFKDIKFNVGLRIDRYDANQMVLKDKYLLYEAYHVNELSGSYASQVPSSVPGSAVVYVADYDAPTKTIIGYRDGDNWYDASGNAVSDPKVIGELSGGQAKPWIVNTAEVKDAKTPYSNGAFTAYKPQINVMPRVAFSFPISDVANFFAHYDILTQRPSNSFNRTDPKDFYYMSSNQGGVVANGNLKPERTIDYELGFSQILNEKKNAALKLTAFYREMRNMVQIVRVNQAYPLNYLTYGNIDFATVKGFSAEFQLRRTAGVMLTANYTLQFAEGSGSNANGGYNLASTGQPNLRVIVPLDFDQRHTFVGTFDYRFGSGQNYRGFNVKFKKDGQPVQVLKDFGLNIQTRLGSGTPYTRRTPAASDEEVGNNTTQSINGDLNGSRYPWQFRTDMRIDKNFTLTGPKSKDGDSKKTYNLNVYIQIINLFNTKNVISVHNYTGSPNDDGYLSSNKGITEVTQKGYQGTAYQQGFVDQYNAKLNDGRYYSQPRLFRIGLMFDF